MDAIETTEIASKETRGRRANAVAITLHFSVSDFAALSSCHLKKLRLTGEDLSREKIVSEALQCMLKVLNTQE